MKFIIAFVSLAFFLGQANAAGPAVRGVQAVLFMSWDDQSVSQFIKTIAANSSGLPANRIELAVLYIDEGLPQHDKTSAGDHAGVARTRWENLQLVVDCLAGVYKL